MENRYTCSKCGKRNRHKLITIKGKKYLMCSAKISDKKWKKRRCNNLVPHIDNVKDGKETLGG